ncbi:MAG: hypothetical protein K1060chlam5_00099 [Candidatus Anoxychlamydiales bacterium]|nr:hypothetical protein [Candidatus Anoxychlamydiales bacterium]
MFISNYLPSYANIKRHTIFTLGMFGSTLPAFVMSASITSLGIFGGSDMQSFVDIAKKSNILNGKVIDVITPLLSPFAISLLVRVSGYAAGLYKVSSLTSNYTIKSYTATKPHISENQKKALKILVISSCAYAYSFTLYSLKDYSITMTSEKKLSNRLGFVTGSITGFLSIIHLSYKLFKS